MKLTHLLSSLALLAFGSQLRAQVPLTQIEGIEHVSSSESVQQNINERRFKSLSDVLVVERGTENSHFGSEGYALFGDPFPTGQESHS